MHNVGSKDEKEKQGWNLKRFRTNNAKVRAERFKEYVTYLRTDPLPAIFTFEGPFDDVVVTRPGIKLRERV